MDKIGYNDIYDTHANALNVKIEKERKTENSHVIGIGVACIDYWQSAKGLQANR